MAYAYVTEPAYGEDPKAYANRRRDIDAILARVGTPQAAAQHQEASAVGLKMLFGMETVE